MEKGTLNKYVSISFLISFLLPLCFCFVFVWFFLLGGGGLENTSNLQLSIRQILNISTMLIVAVKINIFAGDQHLEYIGELEMTPPTEIVYSRSKPT